jgi:cell division inhibitor SulA
MEFVLNLNSYSADGHNPKWLEALSEPLLKKYDHQSGVTAVTVLGPNKKLNQDKLTRSGLLLNILSIDFDTHLDG